ncbi:aldose epimerase family protein [Carnobacterium gallinarum]|uniref:aldose epimerase family protein n=1 Tax=Carnobacterium gallinarum TaxID=2749 RepID=UPI00068E3E78|nr:aldose epimerase family protein [Carnobacterium gallinarum]
MKISQEIIQTNTHQKISIVQLENNNGFKATLSNYGASLIGLMFPNNQGEQENVVLNLAKPLDYLTERTYLGATIGPVAGRITLGQWYKEQQLIQLEQNEGNNHCHGGSHAFDNQFWKMEMNENTQGSYVCFSLVLPAGCEGYPGNRLVTVDYQLTEENQLKIRYHAETDETTILNPTNHTYFNLSGGNEATIANHELQLNSSLFAPLNEENLPTGELVQVTGSVFDFSKKQILSRCLQSQDIQVRQQQGLNHPFILEGNQLYDGCLSHNPSGRKVYFKTTAPSIVIYTGNHFTGENTPENQATIQKHGGIALEMQGLPDAPNHQGFGSIILHPQVDYLREDCYQFTVN